MIGILSLLIALTVGLIITRVAAMALMTTGLLRESARFQARRAVTWFPPQRASVASPAGTGAARNF